jgi:formylglycine-generating enzyme required for sulfatase activity
LGLAQTIHVERVVVGFAGNAADARTGRGAVPYEFSVGKYEVTNTQYAAFLNAVAANDPFGLWRTGMSTNARGGILRSGDGGTYTYSVKPGYELMPVTWVGFWDAARFANWLATGTTEGRTAPGTPLLPGAAYDTNFIAAPALTTATRLPGATIFLPTRDEWYKAAFFQPASAGGPAGDYWYYSTRSDTRPDSALPAVAGSRANQANFFFDAGADGDTSRNGGHAVTQSTAFVNATNYLTNVGIYALSGTFFGTLDQGGNVTEWSETAGSGTELFSLGGTFGGSEGFLDVYGNWSLFTPTTETSQFGFRVAFGPVPEPGTYALLLGALAIGLAGYLRRRRTAGTA